MLTAANLPPATAGRISASTYRWYAIGRPGDTSGMEVPIIGRGHELARARAALVAASDGAGRLVLVSGQPGIGKTRLAAAIADMAGEYGVPVAAGSAIDDPGMLPLWPWLGVGRSVPALATPPAPKSPLGRCTARLHPARTRHILTCRWTNEG